MSVLQDRRVVLGLGAVTAIAVGAAVALGLGRGDAEPSAPPPAAEGGLKIEIGETERAALDPAKPLRCFVDGKFVGLQTLTACAERNGVAAQALDVGLDATGALVAAAEAPAAATPAVDVAADTTVTTAAPETPSPLPDLGPLGPTPAGAAGAPRGQLASCISHGPNGWTTVSEAAPLGLCVTLLFDGRCQLPGNALYGRWGQQTVRVVPGKVEIAQDGQTFNTLAVQNENCTIPSI
jgi:hypothetical protein